MKIGNHCCNVFLPLSPHPQGLSGTLTCRDMKKGKMGDEAPAPSWLRRFGFISEQMARKRQVFWHRQMSLCTSRNIHLQCPLQLGGIPWVPQGTWCGMTGAGRAPSSRGRMSKRSLCSCPLASSHGRLLQPTPGMSPEGCPLFIQGKTSWLPIPPWVIPSIPGHPVTPGFASLDSRT